MEKCIRMWKEVRDRRPWFEVGVDGRGHLLSQLLHGNIYLASDVHELLNLATDISQNPRVEDWGFYDSVGVSFDKDVVTLDHVIEAYGEFSLPLSTFIEVLKKWVAFLENETVSEQEFLIDLEE